MWYEPKCFALCNITKPDSKFLFIVAANLILYFMYKKGSLLCTKGCGNKSVYLQILTVLWKYTDFLLHPSIYNIYTVNNNLVQFSINTKP